MPISSSIISFLPIVATPLETTGSILLVNIYSSEKMCALAELSTMTIDPAESNPNCSGEYALEVSM